MLSFLANDIDRTAKRTAAQDRAPLASASPRLGETVASSEHTDALTAEFGLRHLAIGTLLAGLVVAGLSTPTTVRATVLVVLGMAVVLCSWLLVCPTKSEHGPAFELYWGGFGGGVQGLHVRRSGWLGGLLIVCLSAWLSIAHRAATEVVSSPVATQAPAASTSVFNTNAGAEPAGKLAKGGSP